MTAPEITPLERQCYSLIWYRRGKANPITYRELSERLGADSRAVRNAVERLVTVHQLPICSSYDPKRPGYFWPVNREEVSETCSRLIRHGAAIIKRARIISKASAEEVLGQLRILIEKGE